MNTLASPPLVTTTTGSTALGDLVLQVGSSLMSILGFAGAAPVNFTVPVTAPPCALAGDTPDPSARATAERTALPRPAPSITRLIDSSERLSAGRPVPLLSSPNHHHTKSRRQQHGHHRRQVDVGR